MSYQTVDEGAETQQLHANEQQQNLPTTWFSHRVVVVAVVAFTTVALGVSAITGAAAGRSAANGVFQEKVQQFNGIQLNSDSCEPCDFQQCLASQCDPQVTPYICTSGPSKRGCADSADTWPDSDTCDSCCELDNCAETVARGGSLSTSCEKCTTEQCEIFAGYQQCGADAPYVCTSGSATFGCSGDKNHWPAMEDTQCGECCLMTSCWD